MTWGRLQQLELLNLRGNDISDGMMSSLLENAPNLTQVGVPRLGKATLEVLLSNQRRPDVVCYTQIDSDIVKLAEEHLGEALVECVSSQDPFDVHWL